MKKLLTVLLTLSMTVSLAVPFTVHAQTNDTVDLLSEDSLKHKVGSEDWQFAEDGQLVAANKDKNDSAYLTDYYIESGSHVYIEATAKYDGLAWGIIFAENSVTDPFNTGWFCLNMDYDNCNTRLFCIGTKCTASQVYEPQRIIESVRDGQYHTLGLEITENGTFKLYFDGVLHHVRENCVFEGAYVGLNTCRSDTTFKSFTIKNGAPENYTVLDTEPRALEYSSSVNLLDSDVLKYQSGNGTFTIADGKMSAPNRSVGDTAMMSDIFVNPGEHVYIEVTGKVTDGNAWGIMLSGTGKDNAFAEWMCINLDVAVMKSRMFRPSGSCDIDLPYEMFLFDTGIVKDRDVTMGLEITEDGTFILTCNGIRYGERKPNGWNGAYVGIMTWQASVEFTSASFNVVKGLAAIDRTINDGAFTLSGKMTQDFALSLDKLTSGSDYDELKAQAGDQSVLGAYQVTVESGRAEGTLDLTVNVGNAYNGKTVTFLNKTSDGIETLTATCSGGKVTVQVTDASSFMLTVDKDTEIVTPPTTGDATPVLLLALALGMTAAVICLKKRKFS
ncbi:MAG: hypothetical protein ACI3XR_03215 [Eubacteriales bacterium]